MPWFVGRVRCPQRVEAPAFFNRRTFSRVNNPPMPLPAVRKERQFAEQSCRRHVYICSAPGAPVHRRLFTAIDQCPPPGLRRPKRSGSRVFRTFSSPCAAQVTRMRRKREKGQQQSGRVLGKTVSTQDVRGSGGLPGAPHSPPNRALVWVGGMHALPRRRLFFTPKAVARPSGFGQLYVFSISVLFVYWLRTYPLLPRTLIIVWPLVKKKKE